MVLLGPCLVIRGTQLGWPVSQALGDIELIVNTPRTSFVFDWDWNRAKVGCDNKWIVQERDWRIETPLMTAARIKGRSLFLQRCLLPTFLLSLGVTQVLSFHLGR